MPESGKCTKCLAKTPIVILVCASVIMCIMPVVQLAVGAMYQYECPRQPYIPIYLMVMGVIPLLLSVLAILPCFAGFGNQSKLWSCLVSVFFFCWFITGNVWIYSIYEPNYNKTTTSVEPYCNKTLYMFAVWSTNLTYILSGLLILSGCCTFLLLEDSNPTNV
ncbi:transmembrane protein 272-like isoform X1 [Thunnus thynnus]|uniref:transmembrane protein 272-like isoform X1 n=1 Tax=Thunnus thynnus TaxID=8237 RepID=UPI003527972A